LNSSRFLYSAMFLVLMPLMPVFSQSEFMDRGQRGFGTKLEIVTEGTDFVQAGLDASYSINGLLDIGLEAGHSRDRTGIAGESSYSIQAVYGFTVLKQDRLVPFSIMIPGPLHAVKLVSPALDSSGTIKTDTGYRIGLDVFRFVYAAPRVYLRYGAFLCHESSTYIVERQNGRTGDGYPSSQKNYALLYGAILGFSYRPNRANRGVAVSMDLRTYTCDAQTIHLAPSLSITLVENDLEKQ